MPIEIGRHAAEELAEAVGCSTAASDIKPIFNPYSFGYDHMEFMTRYACLTLVPVFVVMLSAGCAGKPVIQTQVIEKQIAVPCLVEAPSECKSAYAVDRTSAKDDAVTINRALRAEIEERWACEVKLLAAMKGCNKETEKEGAMSEKAGS